MDLKLELVVVPVSDVDRAAEFYEKALGFRLDVDHHPNESFRVVQLRRRARSARSRSARASPNRSRAHTRGCTWS